MVCDGPPDKYVCHLCRLFSLNSLQQYTLFLNVCYRFPSVVAPVVSVMSVDTYLAISCPFNVSSHLACSSIHVENRVFTLTHHLLFRYQKNQ